MYYMAFTNFACKCKFNIITLTKTLLKDFLIYSKLMCFMLKETSIWYQDLKEIYYDIKLQFKNKFYLLLRCFIIVLTNKNQ